MSKFQNDLAERVHRVSMMGIGEEFGSVTENGTYWVFLWIDDELCRVRPRMPRGGYYCLIEDSQGFVNVVQYATEEEWESARDDVSRAMDEFDAEGE